MKSSALRLSSRLIAAFAALGVVTGAAGAVEVGPVELSGSGFLSVVAGKVLGGTHDPATDLGYRCPCFIADYAQNGVYTRRGIQLAPASRAGVQGTASIDGGRYALTGQVVARGSRKAANLEWLYGTFEATSDWTLQVGRKRLPLFLSSEVQDVGYALPWTHLAPQLYGWDVVNFNGASLAYHRPIGSWLANAQLLYGNERVRDSGYWQIYSGKGTRTETRWNHIVGAEAKLSRDWFDVRAVLLQSTTQSKPVSAGEDWTPKAHQRIHGLSFNADDGVWSGRAELLYINRREEYGYDHARLYAAGRRFGPLLATLSYASYRQVVVDDPLIAEGHSTRTFALRYDLGDAMAVKLQYDVWRDKAAPNYTSFHGDARLISVAFDKVF